MSKMYIFINRDLGMSPGKSASQVGHIVHTIVDELVRSSYESVSVPEDYINYMKWNKNCTKIVLKGTTSQLMELLKHKKARGFYDKGETTQGTENKLTVVGFLPGIEIDNIRDFDLL